MLNAKLMAATAAAGIEFVAFAATQNPSTGATLVISKPTGTVDGDLMIAFMCADAKGTSWSGDTGWTEIVDQQSDPDIRIAYKVASSEGSSYTFTYNSAGGVLSGVIATYRNAAYDAIGSITTTTTVTGPTAAENSSVLLGFGADVIASRTISITGSSQVAIDNDGTAPSWYLGSEEIDAGAVGTRTVDYGGGGSRSSVLMVIKPA